MGLVLTLDRMTADGPPWNGGDHEGAHREGLILSERKDHPQHFLLASQAPMFPCATIAAATLALASGLNGDAPAQP